MLQIRRKSLVASLLALTLLLQLFAVPASQASAQAATIADGVYNVPITYYEDNTTHRSIMNDYVVPNSAVLTVANGTYTLQHKFIQPDAMVYVGLLKAGGTKAVTYPAPNSASLLQYDQFTQVSKSQTALELSTAILNPYEKQTVLAHVVLPSLNYDHWYHVQLLIDMSQFDNGETEPPGPTNPPLPEPEPPVTINTSELEAIIDEATETLGTLKFLGETALANPENYGTTDELILKYILEVGEIPALPAITADPKKAFQTILTNAEKLLIKEDVTQEEINNQVTVVKSELALLLSRQATAKVVPIEILTSRASNAEISPYATYFSNEATLYDGNGTQFIRVTIEDYSQFIALGTKLTWYNAGYNPITSDGTATINGTQTLRKVSYNEETDAFVGQLTLKPSYNNTTTGLVRAAIVLPNSSTVEFFIHTNVYLQEELTDLYTLAATALEQAEIGSEALQYSLPAYQLLEAALQSAEPVKNHPASQYSKLVEEIEKLQAAYDAFLSSQNPDLLAEGTYHAAFSVTNEERIPSNVLSQYIVSPAYVHADEQTNRIYFTLANQNVITTFSINDYEAKTWLINEQKQQRIVYVDLPYMPAALHAYIEIDYAAANFYIEENIIITFDPASIVETNERITLPGDYEKLALLITEVQAALQKAVEGKARGNYPEGSKAIVQEKLNQASTYLAPYIEELHEASKYTADAEATNTELQQLTASFQAFKASVVKGSNTATPVIPDEVIPTPAPTLPPIIDEENGNETNTAAFKDTQQHWANSYIQVLTDKGIIQGYENGEFRPNNQITRAEVAVLLTRLLQLKPSSEEKSFVDQQQLPGWAQAAIQAVNEQGIMNGYANGSFMPSNEITRAELAVIVARVVKLSQATSNESVSFSDEALIPAWAKADIQAVAAAGYFEGDTNGAFHPNDKATRAEVAKILALLLEQLPASK